MQKSAGTSQPFTGGRQQPSLHDLTGRQRLYSDSGTGGGQSDKVGNILLPCSILSGLGNFDLALIIAILNQIQVHLSVIYPEVMASGTNGAHLEK